MKGEKEVKKCSVIMNFSPKEIKQMAKDLGFAERIIREHLEIIAEEIHASGKDYKKMILENAIVTAKLKRESKKRGKRVCVNCGKFLGRGVKGIYSDIDGGKWFCSPQCVLKSMRVAHEKEGLKRSLIKQIKEL